MDALAEPIPVFASISAVITRADGTVEDLGVIDASYKNPLDQFVWAHIRKPLADRRIRQANKRARA